MWITKGGAQQLITDSTFPYWQSLGWQADSNRDLIGDETAAAAVAPGAAVPNPLSSAAAAGTATATARADHTHTGQKLAAVAAPTAPGVVYSQAEAASAVAAINAIRAALTAHGITL